MHLHSTDVRATGLWHVTFWDWNDGGFLPMVRYTARVQELLEELGENPTSLSATVLERPSSEPIRTPLVDVLDLYLQRRRDPGS